MPNTLQTARIGKQAS